MESNVSRLYNWKRQCVGMNGNSPDGLICLNVWCPVGKTAPEELSVTLPEDLRY